MAQVVRDPPLEHRFLRFPKWVFGKVLLRVPQPQQLHHLGGTEPCNLKSRSQRQQLADGKLVGKGKIPLQGSNEASDMRPKSCCAHSVTRIEVARHHTTV